MRTWIFQGNPDDFDLDAYLATAPIRFPWLVTRYGDEISAGDRVYIWRTQGKQKGIAGLIAEAEVIARVALLPESPDAIPFWRADASAAMEVRPRGILRLVRVATPREVIRRDWCEEDPVLRTLPNLKMAAATNYPLGREQLERLAALWSRTGRDWTRDESVAGLWAYAKTSGGSVSRVPGSPVAACQGFSSVCYVGNVRPRAHSSPRPVFDTGRISCADNRLVAGFTRQDTDRTLVGQHPKPW